MFRIALLDDYQRVAMSHADWDALPEQTELRVFHDHLASQEAVARRLEPFDAVMALRERTAFPRELLAQLPNLKLLCTAGAWNAAIDVDACTELGIVVCGTGSYGSTTMELTWGLIFAATRHIPAEWEAMREEHWQQQVGFSLQGRTLGLLGLGRIGAAMCPVAQAFGMRVLAWSQNLTPERAAECGAEAVPLERLLAESDVVSIHLKLSERTTGLLGRRELAQMQPHAVLVNTSRGPIVDEAALVDALQHQGIAGAGLDVFDTEPLPREHPLMALPNVVLTPHIGYVTREVYDRFYGDTLANIQGYLAGSPTQVLNPDVLPNMRPRTG